MPMKIAKKRKRKAEDPPGMTPRMARFVDEWHADFNGVRAARAAGYKGTNKSLSVTATQLLKHPAVVREVRQRAYESVSELQLTRKAIIQRLACLALRDPAEFCDPDGIIRIDDLRKLPMRIRVCIDGLKVKQQLDEDGQVVGQTIEVKISPVLPAVECAMKYKGLFPSEKVDLTARVMQIPWDEFACLSEQQVIEAESRVLEDKKGTDEEEQDAGSPH